MKSIIFRDKGVRAILRGRKKQTRRVIANMPEQPKEAGAYFDAYAGGPYWNWWLPDNRAVLPQIKCPYGQPSDLLWVRETWAPGRSYGGEYPVVFYGSTNEGWIGSEQYPPAEVQVGKFGITTPGSHGTPPKSIRWKPSIHMPRWASRITLRITDVRVERLQDIKPCEAIAEGIQPDANSFTIDCDTPDPRHEFRSLWDTINAKRGYSWDSNPWVWALTFERVTKPTGAR